MRINENGFLTQNVILAQIKIINEKNRQLTQLENSKIKLEKQNNDIVDAFIQLNATQIKN
jgi:hypothetical protein